MGRSHIQAHDAGVVTAWGEGLLSRLCTYHDCNSAELLRRHLRRLPFSFADQGSGQWPLWSHLSCSSCKVDSRTSGKNWKAPWHRCCTACKPMSSTFTRCRVGTQKGQHNHHVMSCHALFLLSRVGWQSSQVSLTLESTYWHETRKHGLTVPFCLRSSIQLLGAPCMELHAWLRNRHLSKVMPVSSG